MLVVMFAIQPTLQRQQFVYLWPCGSILNRTQRAERSRNGGLSVIRCPCVRSSFVDAIAGRFPMLAWKWRVWYQPK